MAKYDKAIKIVTFGYYGIVQKQREVSHNDF